jgi:hypothetical protein
MYNANSTSVVSHESYPANGTSIISKDEGYYAFSPFDHFHHRFPLSAAVSVRKSMTKAFALESGLRYTYLHSDISREGAAGYIGNQKLHYLGIPLRADWLFYSQGRVSAYLAAGTLFEYAVSAQRQLHGLSSSLDINRFQASVTAAVGMQLALVKPISVFIEPGIGYYFDNGNGIETFRTEKPWMLNLQAGIRFSY